jgi:hypothetical protein
MIDTPINVTMPPITLDCSFSPSKSRGLSYFPKEIALRKFFNLLKQEVLAGFCMSLGVSSSIMTESFSYFSSSE